MDVCSFFLVRLLLGSLLCNDQPKSAVQVGTIDLYAVEISSPSRSVILLLDHLGLRYNLISVNPALSEHLKPEFQKLSPQHTIPTIVDNGFTLTESNAILQYLTEKYGRNSGLIPENIEERAAMHRMLDYDMATVYQRFLELHFYPRKYQTPTGAHLKPNFDSALKTFNDFLAGHTWVVGNKMTLADFRCASTFATLAAWNALDLAPYQNIINWYTTAARTMKSFDKNERGAKAFTDGVKTMALP